MVWRHSCKVVRMSWDLYLVHPVNGTPIELPMVHHVKGGTYALGGTREAWLNVTYNYGKHFSFSDLAGLTAAESIPIMQETADTLDARATDSDYWKPTQGNVRKALEDCIALAKLAPAAAVWEVR